MVRQMIDDQLDRTMFLECRFGVLMQFVQYVTEGRGLASIEDSRRSCSSSAAPSWLAK